MGIVIRRKVQAVTSRLPPRERSKVNDLVYRLSRARKYNESWKGRDKRVYKFLSLYKGTPLPAEICYRIARQA